MSLRSLARFNEENQEEDLQQPMVTIFLRPNLLPKRRALTAPAKQPSSYCVGATFVSGSGSDRMARDPRAAHDGSVGSLHEGGVVLTLNSGIACWEAARQSQAGRSVFGKGERGM